MSAADRGTYYLISALCDRPNTLTQLRVEVRDYQYKLVSRALFSPWTDGGGEVALAKALELWRKLLADHLSTDAAALSGEDGLNG